jgi:hypothetical protein
MSLSISNEGNRFVRVIVDHVTVQDSKLNVS